MFQCIATNHNRTAIIFVSSVSLTSSQSSFDFLFHFSQLLYFTHNVREWLDRDPENVVAVHCKGGKGTCKVLN